MNPSTPSTIAILPTSSQAWDASYAKQQLSGLLVAVGSHTCGSCLGELRRPVTLACQHNCCETCVGKIAVLGPQNKNLTHACPQCKAEFDMTDGNMPRLNLALDAAARLVTKPPRAGLHLMRVKDAKALFCCAKCKCAPSDDKHVLQTPCGHIYCVGCFKDRLAKAKTERQEVTSRPTKVTCVACTHNLTRFSRLLEDSSFKIDNKQMLAVFKILQEILQEVPLKPRTARKRRASDPALPGEEEPPAKRLKGTAAETGDEASESERLTAAIEAQAKGKGSRARDKGSRMLNKTMGGGVVKAKAKAKGLAAIDEMSMKALKRAIKAAQKEKDAMKARITELEKEKKAKPTDVEKQLKTALAENIKLKASNQKLKASDQEQDIKVKVLQKQLEAAMTELHLAGQLLKVKGTPLRRTVARKRREDLIARAGVTVLSSHMG